MSDKPDWTTAPKDAQFYSIGSFSKHENGHEFYYAGDCWHDIGGYWHGTSLESMAFHEGFPDFEMRPESPEWDGKGLPPVGAVCEHHTGRKYVVTGYANQDTELPEAFPVTVIYRNIETGKVWCKPFGQWKESFKPVRSDRDKWVDAALEHLKEHYGWMRVDSMTSEEVIADIYDALKSGKLPAP